MPRLGASGEHWGACGGDWRRRGARDVIFDTEQWTRSATHVDIDRHFLRRWTHTHQRTCTPSFEGRLRCTAEMCNTTSVKGGTIAVKYAVLWPLKLEMCLVSNKNIYACAHGLGEHTCQVSRAGSNMGAKYVAK